VGDQNDLIHVEELHLPDLMRVPLAGMLSTIAPDAKV
jgi:hypothetical protein